MTEGNLMTTVLIAGATGMLGATIAAHLLDEEGVDVRLLVRTPRGDVDKAEMIDGLAARGATVVVGDVGDPASLDAATHGVDVVISALQGGRAVIVDGQIALAEAAERNGVRRFIPSDFALDLFAAPAGAPQFDMRKEADAAIDAMAFEVVHVLNGAFMDMMLDPKTAGIVNLADGSAQLWGTGDERFNLTTVDDTARFTAKLAIDPADVSGVRTVSGAQTTFNEIIAESERLSGTSLTKNVLGDADDLRRITAAADDPWSVVMQWYVLAMITVPPFARTDNDRYPNLRLTSLHDYLEAAHRAIHATAPPTPSASIDTDRTAAPQQPANESRAFVTTREEAPSYWLVDSLWSVLATAESTGGALTVLDQIMPRRSGPPPHVHDRLHEYFYLLEGQINFQIGDAVKAARAGSMLSIPAGTVHGFAVVSETARVLNLYTPGGFTEQISYLGTPATELRLPREDEQLAATSDQQNAYLTRSAELNTQRWLLPGEGQDLLAGDRDPFQP